MLHVVIDLTSLPRLKGGVGVYLTELISALDRVAAEQRYSILIRSEHRDGLQPGSERFRVVPVKLRSRPLRLAWEQVGLPSLVREIRGDVLHSPHYTRPLSRLACASVVGVMDMTFFRFPQYHTLVKRLFFRTMLHAAVRRADRFLAISESTGRDLQKYLGVPQDRIDITPLAVSDAYRPLSSPELEAVRRRYNLPPAYILFVGRLEPRKNVPRLLDAYTMLLQDGIDVPPLVLAGAKGWHMRALDERLRQLTGRVNLLGYVLESDLPAVYAGARLFVYPSVYEGFGIPVLEALSCGVPTITSNVSSMPEVAGDAAELIDPYDTNALRGAMARLIRDDQRCAELRRSALRRASTFSWDRTARLTAEAYARAFDQWRRQPH
jgi:glycosyltransferase involved in cell wall biosynthesis